MTKLIIGFTGKKASGKTTAGVHMCRKKGFIRHSFADPIKTMAFHFIKSFGYADREAYDFLNGEKETTIPKIACSGRRIMQTLGTEWGRRCIRDDVWVRAEIFNLGQTTAQRIVFDDVRFENEAALIRAMGGTIIHIDRSFDADHEIDHHASESGIHEQSGDLFIDNDGSLDDFIKDLDALIEQNITGHCFINAIMNRQIVALAELPACDGEPRLSKFLGL